jgi:hypothetical protein
MFRPRGKLSRWAAFAGTGRTKLEQVTDRSDSASWGEGAVVRYRTGSRASGLDLRHVRLEDNSIKPNMGGGETNGLYNF